MVLEAGADLRHYFWVVVEAVELCFFAEDGVFGGGDGGSGRDEVAELGGEVEELGGGEGGVFGEVVLVFEVREGVEVLGGEVLVEGRGVGEVRGEYVVFFLGLRHGGPRGCAVEGGGFGGRREQGALGFAAGWTRRGS